MSTSDSSPLSRRAVVGGGVGLAAAAAAGPVVAQTATSAPASGAPPAPDGAQVQGAARPVLENPLDKHPRPPFPEQSQPWPGLFTQMTPEPDLGQKSYRGAGRLTGRKALITGGDSGIGGAAAIAFAREGADVAISHLPEEEPDARVVLKCIRDAGRTGLSLPGDIRDEAFCGSLVEQALAGLGGLDILVMNAARQHPFSSIEDLSTEYFDWTMKTNIYAPFWIIKAALPHLPPGSAIIATASIQAYDPLGELYDYAQTKAATMNYVKSLAKQFASRGIRVNGVAPGPIWTPLQVSGGASLKQLVNFGAYTPFKRPGQPAELASLYVELAANDASYSSGQIFGAMGGSAPVGG
jgi:NAD(P)-dependent dehydrogenase (short-subunit alcohol dehydrogenase family)